MSGTKVLLLLGGLVAAPSLLPSENAPLAIPGWLSPFPQAREQRMTASTVSLDAFYTAVASSAQVIEHYEKQLHQGGITFQSNFDGIGTMIRASGDKTSCVIRATEGETGTGVKISCARLAEDASPGFTLPLAATPTTPFSSAPPKQTTAVPTSEWPRSCTVDYEIDGPMKAVSFTVRNDTGGTDQKVARLPYKDHFLAPAGSLLYLSAQKARLDLNEHTDILARRDDLIVDGISGTVHVAIRVNDSVVEEATASAPYGIATAKGNCPR